MASKKKLLQAAAGAAGDAGLDVDDVFSIFIHEGDDNNKTIQNGINLGSSYAGPSFEFDGSNDVLLRSSDFTSNSDSKTFTFSCWFFANADQTAHFYSTSPDTSSNGRAIFGTANGVLSVTHRNDSGTTILNISSNADVPIGQWNHLLVSVDLNNASRRHVYLNDSTLAVTYNTYTNDTIGFTNPIHAIGGNSYNQLPLGSQYLAHIYLDYTYRDLSTESNRRLFYTSTGVPATGQASLNPIMYMPMDTDGSIASNSGTGGDFTVTGSPEYHANFGPYIGSSGEGGLIFSKSIDNAVDWGAYDTDGTGTGNELKPNASDAMQADSDLIQSFNANGFTTGPDVQLNQSARGTYCTWTFRKAPKFFDIVTYTGNGTAGRTISHNLGSDVGFMAIKRKDSSGTWSCFHRSLNTTSGEKLNLNSNTNAGVNNLFFNSTAPTSTEFTVGSSSNTNASGGTYVAYLWAHNNSDGEFGPNADQDIIKCGTWTGNGTQPSGTSINLGFEPQFIMWKRADADGDWYWVDSLRGFDRTNQSNKFLKLNATDIQHSGDDYVLPSPTGFDIEENLTAANANGGKYVYMAIRRGSLFEPENATDVFAIDTANSTGNAPPQYYSGFPVDMVLRVGSLDSTNNNFLYTRLLGSNYLLTEATDAATSTSFTFDLQDGFSHLTSTSTNNQAWMWKRAPSYFDVVCYTGNGTSGNTISHNLGVVPEMMWVKNRDTAGYDWFVYHKDLDATAPEDKYIRLNTTGAVADTTAYWNDTAPTASVFSLGNGAAVNANNEDHIAYLFATLAGISKVGSYTGNGTGQNIDCGFSSGARFVLIKRISSTQNWYLFDSVRGIVSGNDPYIMINNTTQQFSNDYLDPYSSGFAVTGSNVGINDNGSTYIFYAIA